MPAYLIASVDVKDAATFEEYRKQVPATIAKHGGKYLVRTLTDAFVVEGA